MRIWWPFFISFTLRKALFYRRRICSHTLNPSSKIMPYQDICCLENFLAQSVNENDQSRLVWYNWYSCGSQCIWLSIFFACCVLCLNFFESRFILFSIVWSLSSLQNYRLKTFYLKFFNLTGIRIICLLDILIERTSLHSFVEIILTNGFSLNSFFGLIFKP